MRHWQRIVGVGLGLLVAAIIADRIPIGGSSPGRPASGSLVPDCEGAIRALAIQYVARADFAVPVYRDFLRQLPAEVTVYVICPDEQAGASLLEQVGPVSCRVRCVPVGHDMTAWSRDRWLTLSPAAPGSPATLLYPRGEAAADIWPARAGDGRIAADLAATHPHQLFARQSDLYFDGGDYVADARCVFVTPAVLRRNLQQTVASRDELVELLRSTLQRQIVLLDEAPDHHAGMFMMAAGQGTVLVGDPSSARPVVEAAGQPLPPLPGGPDYTTQTQARFDAVARQAAEAGYRVVRMPLVPACDGRTYLTYLNVIIDHRNGVRTVYMPVYSGVEALNAAAEKVWRELGYQVRRVDCSSAYPQFGSLRCLVNVLEKA